MRITTQGLAAAKQAGRWAEIERRYGEKDPELVFQEISQIPAGGLIRDLGNANRVLHSFPVGIEFINGGYTCTVDHVDVKDYSIGTGQNYYIQKTGSGEFEVVAGFGCSGDEPITGPPLPVKGQEYRYNFPPMVGPVDSMARFLPKIN